MPLEEIGPTVLSFGSDFRALTAFCKQLFLGRPGNSHSIVVATCVSRELELWML